MVWDRQAEEDFWFCFGFTFLLQRSQKILVTVDIIFK